MPLGALKLTEAKIEDLHLEPYLPRGGADRAICLCSRFPMASTHL